METSGTPNQDKSVAWWASKLKALHAQGAGIARSSVSNQIHGGCSDIVVQAGVINGGVWLGAFDERLVLLSFLQRAQLSQRQHVLGWLSKPPPNLEARVPPTQADLDFGIAILWENLQQLALTCSNQVGEAAEAVWDALCHSANTQFDLHWKHCGSDQRLCSIDADAHEDHGRRIVQAIDAYVRAVRSSRAD
ncbi:hypothetical protein ACWCZ5_15110 [Streptomyces sp. NPDC001667]